MTQGLYGGDLVVVVGVVGVLRDDTKNALRRRLMCMYCIAIFFKKKKMTF